LGAPAAGPISLGSWYEQDLMLSKQWWVVLQDPSVWVMFVAGLNALKAAVTPHPTSRILFTFAHGPHGFVLGNHALPQYVSY